MKKDRYQRALIRNLHEVGMAIFERKALIGLKTADSCHAWDFFRVAYYALFNDMMAHSIKVLDRHPASASFWYIYRCKKKEINLFLTELKVDMKDVELLAAKLKKVRDKTHFHIDKNAVFDPKKVWKKAGIKGKFLGQVLDVLWRVLNYLHNLQFNKGFPAPAYNGEDAAKIVKAAQKAGII